MQHNDAAANDDDDEYDNNAADCDDGYMMGLRYKKICEVQTRNLLDNKTSHFMTTELDYRVYNKYKIGKVTIQGSCGLHQQQRMKQLYLFQM
ncbi:hypothetical protein DPMN_062732 [Dreissena polymorpha]|uniref:Uncharacterized protein n=1 Tax=Dreissena polymorpha TaxID=45954 RepID=A0A9D4CAB1_DREPO|nr:hypothetical protein DPMN_062732 [Dreissena polymorpha]